MSGTEPSEARGASATPRHELLGVRFRRGAAEPELPRDSESLASHAAPKTLRIDIRLVGSGTSNCLMISRHGLESNVGGIVYFPVEMQRASSCHVGARYEHWRCFVKMMLWCGLYCLERVVVYSC